MPIAISGPNIGVATNCLTMAENTTPISRACRPGILTVGQWTALGLGEESEAEYRDSATEFSSTGKSKGHHVVPRAVYKNISLPPETRKIFDEATTGPIRLRASSEGGLLRGHYWDGPNGAHGQYSQAVHNLLAEYMVEHKIGAERMTPDQAGTFVEKVK
jgi:hypothetical protein